MFTWFRQVLTPLRMCVLGVAVAVLAPLVYFTCAAIGASRLTAAAVALVAALLTVPLGVRVTPPRLPKRRSSQRVLFVLWVVLGAVAAFRLAGLGVFMLDVEKVEHAVDPTVRVVGDPDMEKPFFPKHNCFTCYMVAAELAARNTDNLYDPAHYRNPEEKTTIHETIGDALHIDRFQYPPPFLLLPRLLLATGHDFFQIRTYWFALNVLVFLATAVALIKWLGGYQFNVYWLVWPLVLLAPTTLSTLQIGNAHFLVVCMSVAALLCFEVGWTRFGGGLLGFAILSKIFPGVALVYLLARRRWSAVAWTTLAMVALSLAALLILGRRPFDAFVSYQLPRIASGEAFSFAFEHIRPLTLNWSIAGIAYKIQRLGVLAEVDVGSVSVVVSWLYSGVVVFAAVVIGVRHSRREPAGTSGRRSVSRRVGLARVWLVLLVLAQLRSPFLPWAYGGTAVLWLLMLLLPRNGAWFWKTALVAVAWFLVSTHVPLAFGPATSAFDLSYTLVVLLCTLVLCSAILILEWREPTWGNGVGTEVRSTSE